MSKNTAVESLPQHMAAVSLYMIHLSDVILILRSAQSESRHISQLGLLIVLADRRQQNRHKDERYIPASSGQ